MVVVPDPEAVPGLRGDVSLEHLHRAIPIARVGADPRLHAEELRVGVDRLVTPTELEHDLRAVGHPGLPQYPGDV